MDEINYRAPIILDVLHRIPTSGEEFVQEMGIQWKTIMSLKSYPYEDDWRQNPGPKFFITIYQEGGFLCKGKFRDMFNLWKEYLVAHGKDFDF